MSDEVYDVLEAVVLKPGDTLIVRVTPNISNKQARQLRDSIRAAIPQLGAVAIIAADQLGVMRQKPEPVEVIPLQPKKIVRREKS